MKLNEFVPMLQQRLATEQSEPTALNCLKNFTGYIGTEQKLLLLAQTDALEFVRSWHKDCETAKNSSLNSSARQEYFAKKLQNFLEQKSDNFEKALLLYMVLYWSVAMNETSLLLSALKQERVLRLKFHDDRGQLFYHIVAEEKINTIFGLKITAWQLECKAIDLMTLALKQGQVDVLQILCDVWHFIPPHLSLLDSGAELAKVWLMIEEVLRPITHVSKTRYNLFVPGPERISVPHVQNIYGKRQFEALELYLSRCSLELLLELKNKITGHMVPAYHCLGMIIDKLIPKAKAFESPERPLGARTSKSLMAKVQQSDVWQDREPQTILGFMAQTNTRLVNASQVPSVRFKEALLPLAQSRIGRPV